MIALRIVADGVILPVRAQPGARRAGVRGAHDGMLKVSVTTAAEKGKANQAIVELLSDELSLPASAVQLVAGATARQKQFKLCGLSEADARGRIDAALARAAASK